MKVVYVTDLHGSEDGYRMALRCAVEHGASTIVNGGDMLPKGSGIIKEQKRFINQFLASIAVESRSHGVEWRCMFGNDDLRSRIPTWDCLCSGHSNMRDMSRAWEPLGDFWLHGSNTVPDYPFGLKDWTALDSRGWTRPTQRSRPVLSSDSGFTEILDPELHFFRTETVHDRVKRALHACPDLSRAVLVTHSPPSGLGLSNLCDGTDVGSAATLELISLHAPMLTLHGHIHESPSVTGVRTVTLSNGTQCHQPGQLLPDRATLSVIELKLNAAPVIETLTLDT
jgi:Icc-related predicted phosphoesterase